MISDAIKSQSNKICPLKPQPPSTTLAYLMFRYHAKSKGIWSHLGGELCGEVRPSGCNSLKSGRLMFEQCTD